MAIMSVVDRADARASARVMARTAQRCIDGELERRTHRIELAGIYRLLNAYKAHRFVGYEYEPRSSRGPEALTLMPGMDRHVVDLRTALDAALADTFGEGNGEQGIEFVILSVSQPDPPAEHATRTSRFLGAFIERLTAH